MFLSPYFLLYRHRNRRQKLLNVSYIGSHSRYNVLKRLFFVSDVWVADNFWSIGLCLFDFILWLSHKDAKGVKCRPVLRSQFLSIYFEIVVEKKNWK